MSDATDNPIIGCLLTILIIIVFLYACGQLIDEKLKKLFGTTTTTNTRTVDDSSQHRVMGTAREVDTLNLNMRSGPGTSYSVVAAFPKGTTLVCYGETTTADGELWTEASTSDGQTRGWVNRKYLSP